MVALDKHSNHSTSTDHCNKSRLTWKGWVEVSIAQTGVITTEHYVTSARCSIAPLRHVHFTEYEVTSVNAPVTHHTNICVMLPDNCQICRHGRVLSYLLLSSTPGHIYYELEMNRENLMIERQSGPRFYHVTYKQCNATAVVCYQ